MKYLILSMLLLNACAVTAVKGDEIMKLKGFGAKKAVFSDNSSIEKQEPFAVPDIKWGD